MNLQTMSTWSTTKFAGRLYGGIVACAYLFVVGLAEIWRVAAEPHLKFILYSLVLLALFLQAVFDTQEKVRRLCLALTLVPLTRLLGFAMPASLFPLLGQYLLLAVVLLVAAGFVIRNLALQPEQIGLGLGHGPFGGQGPLGLVSYVPLMLTAVPLGLVKYVLLQSALPNDVLALPTLSPLVVAAVSLCAGFVETLIFYSIVLHVSRDLLGERASSLYVALLVGALYLGHAPWPGDLFVFVVSLLYSWVVLKTHTIYAVALSHVFVAYFLLLAPLLTAGRPGTNMISAISPVELTLSTILPAVLLIGLLILKQLAVASGAGHWRAFGRYLNIALVPLLITFLVTVAIKISLIFQ